MIRFVLQIYGFLKAATILNLLLGSLLVATIALGIIPHQRQRIAKHQRTTHSSL